MGGAFLLLTACSTIWIGVDASQRDWSSSKLASSTASWVIGSLLLWVIVFPIYLVARSRVPLKGIAPLAGGPQLPSEGMKTCPDCAEPIQAMARKCRYCGFRIEPPALPAA